MKPPTAILFNSRRVDATQITLCLLVIASLPTVARAEKLASGSQSIAELLAQQPVAECAVQTIGGEAEPAEMRVNPVMLGSSMTSDPLDNYARSRDGEWQIPSEAEGDDPWVRLLLLPPERPVIIDLAVTFEGRSYRLARQKWVELLLSQAKGKYSPVEKVEKTEEERQDKLPSTPPDSESDAGTSPPENTSDKATDEQADDLAEDKSAAEADEAKATGIKPESRKAPTVIQRLKNYVTAVGDEVDPQEVRWLLADWTGGPELIVLGPAVAWQRAEVAPLWSWLDVDADGVLSAEETAQAYDRLQQADVDEDDIVDLAELFRNEQLGSPYHLQYTHPLAVVIDDDTDWFTLLDELNDVYGDEYVSKSASDLEEFKSCAADLVCRVALDAKAGKFAVLSVNSSLGEAAQLVTPAENVITAEIGGSYLELSAALPAPNEQAEVAAPQIALGAAVDGYPLFRLLDADSDQRITSPEQRQLNELLQGLDRDGDGQIGQNEIPTAIRVAITSGPHAHELLRERTRAARLRTRERLPVPGWFTDMDRNRDGELSRREFLGTSAQFDQLDHNGNGLIGDQEVQESPPTGEPP
jgi:Ca2+-binding EF-hand superfamily protein